MERSAVIATKPSHTMPASPSLTWFHPPQAAVPVNDVIVLLQLCDGRERRLSHILPTDAWPIASGEVIAEVAGAADPVTRTFLVKADAGKLALSPGQSATVVLELPQTSGVIKLPLAAVLQQSGKTSVWVLDGASMTVKPVPVTVAGAEGNEVVIAAGLTPGQEVVVAGVHVLNPGQKVKRYVPPRAAESAPAAAAPAAPAASR